MNYDNSGKGALWSNPQWTPGDKGPKWTGKLTADRDIKMGEEIPLSVWQAERKGEKSPVMRLQVNRWKEKKENVEAVKHQASTTKPAFDDDIPFSTPARGRVTNAQIGVRAPVDGCD